jgi:glycosyltransferase involved in cell wall biosynthesis
MIAFHFPPQRGSSGIQRTLRFARYLPEFGWEPHVLTVHPRAYDATDASVAVPDGVRVHRAFALDAARHLALRGRYASLLARPDRWASWWWSAVPVGLNLIRKLRPQALWSTYPIATAHAIGNTLARLTNVPWIADFRDPMAQDGYPVDPAVWRRFAHIEARALAIACHSVFTTPGAAQRYRTRYPARAQRISVIENGYDEELFENLPSVQRRSGPPLVLLHSGIVYPSERDPSALFAALRVLRERGVASRDTLLLRLRAPVHVALIEDLATRHAVRDLIEIAPPLPYREALAEMLTADGLVVLQAANCNEQIPAKLYEYLRAGRPILGLADPRGDTADALRDAGITHLAALENAEAIADALQRFVDDVSAGRAPLPAPGAVLRASRRVRTAELAALLERASAAAGCA